MISFFNSLLFFLFCFKFQVASFKLQVFSLSHSQAVLTSENFVKVLNFDKVDYVQHSQFTIHNYKVTSLGQSILKAVGFGYVLLLYILYCVETVPPNSLSFVSFNSNEISYKPLLISL